MRKIGKGKDYELLVLLILHSVLCTSCFIHNVLGMKMVWYLLTQEHHRAWFESPMTWMTHPVILCVMKGRQASNDLISERLKWRSSQCWLTVNRLKMLIHISVCHLWLHKSQPAFFLRKMGFFYYGIFAHDFLMQYLWELSERQKSTWENVYSLQ